MKAVAVFAVLVMAFGAWWIINAPPSFIHIGPKLELDAVSQTVLEVTSKEDVVRTSSSRTAPTLPGYDEVILYEDRGEAYATSTDGWIWKIDLVAGTASRFVDVPLMAAGARRDPSDENRIYFCASYLYGATYPKGERVGLYQLDLQSRAVTPVVLAVPKVEGIGGAPRVFPDGAGPISRDILHSGKISRALAFCNDLDVSGDGQRIYFTEPFAYENASMGGGGTYREAVSMGQNGFVWQYDRTEKAVSLVAQNYTFPDGILVEDNGAESEESLLVAETIKFQIQRLILRGNRAGQSEIVQQNLPAMPDGLDRDANGTIWVGMIKQRSSTVDWIHRNPWIKHLLLRLPHTMMPVSRETSYMALSQDAATPLFYSVHDGSVLTEISVVIPGRDRLFLATVGHDSRGLYSVPYPEGLKPPTQ
ncbi:MAG: SMP-30/gluconolaconase/LRE-like region [Robiginitomaculum sp.]|nr:MAG: SMP-30/gluconolaconase/LRE-like region [Robiginitomaculum sp.]